MSSKENRVRISTGRSLGSPGWRQLSCKHRLLIRLAFGVRLPGLASAASMASLIVGRQVLGGFDAFLGTGVIPEEAINAGHVRQRHQTQAGVLGNRSEERRVGKEC